LKPQASKDVAIQPDYNTSIYADTQLNISISNAYLEVRSQLRTPTVQVNQFSILCLCPLVFSTFLYCR
ncbi:hypothetical protein AB4302_14175, partial [Vibrio breoganii]|uniref:hypothetical protein n=1 Tax=Vibrio breoganii TaxID=553239 RepID=UPI001A7E158E